MLEIARVVNDKPISLPDAHGLPLPPNEAGSRSMRGYVLEPRTAGKKALPQVPALPAAPAMDTTR